MQTMPAPWVPQIACRPIAFAQVREDATLDGSVVEQLDGGAKVLMIASGGCTAAALAASPQISRLHLIDPNPAQIALSRLKLRLLATAETSERAAILGHSFMPLAERRERLTVHLQKLDLPLDSLGPIDLVAELGPDQAGRYEGLFLKLREALSDAADEVTALLELRDPDEQARRVDEATHLGRTLDAAFDSVMALPNLIALFGEGATRNRCEPFSRHFARRTRHALATLPAANNPYLWQLLQGRFPPHVVYPWLTAAPTRIAEVRCTVTSMGEGLRGQHGAYDFIHVSNILDWLTPEDARSTLDLVWHALRPGGRTLIRQLNSSIDIKGLGRQFEWQERSADALHKRDRSFFYRALHLGRKK
jgi:S-adenosylmethionine-diacylglycerol 3-amino-3-carboxypropyl transferase